MAERKFRILFASVVLLQLIGTALVALQQHRHQQQLQQQLAFFAAALASAPNALPVTTTASSTSQQPLQQLLREVIRAELQQRSSGKTAAVAPATPDAPAMTAAAKREQALQFARLPIDGSHDRAEVARERRAVRERGIERSTRRPGERAGEPVRELDDADSFEERRSGHQARSMERRRSDRTWPESGRLGTVGSPIATITAEAFRSMSGYAVAAA